MSCLGVGRNRTSFVNEFTSHLNDAASICYLWAAAAWRGCKEDWAWPQPVCRPCGFARDPERSRKSTISAETCCTQFWESNAVTHHQPLISTVNPLCFAGDSLQKTANSWWVITNGDAALKTRNVFSPPRSCKACVLHCCSNRTSRRRTSWDSSAPLICDEEDNSDTICCFLKYFGAFYGFKW